MFILPVQLYELKNYDNWVVYRLFNNGTNKLSKLPFNPITHKPAKTNNSSTWGSYSDSINAIKEHSYDGIGFVLSDFYVGIDLDNCIVDNTINDTAKDILELIQSYTEYSPSNNGLHIICKYMNHKKIGRKNDKLGLEIYNRDRFFTITGKVYRDLLIVDQTKEIDILLNKYFNDMSSILNEYLSEV